MDVRLMLVLTLAAPELMVSTLHAQSPSGRDYTLQRTAEAIPLRDAARLPRLSAGITLRRDRAPLEDVLREIARQAQIGISYGEDLPRSGVLVSINVYRLRAADALEAAVRGTPWTLLYAPSGQLMVVPRPPVLEGIITGRVTARAGQPIAGATVLVDGTQLATTADTGGLYRLSGVPAGAHTVLARRIGYLPSRQSVTVTDGGTATLDFTLEATATSLSAVIVTGTAGNQTRVAQSAVVASIDAADVVAKAPVSTVSDMLTSRVPGITITRGAGTVGAASRINIRGAASISLSNEPLVFIDGVRMQSGQRNFFNLGGQTISALNDINPADIESIEVVKGPAAATLYGADASAGVIQIITKKGQTGARGFRQTLTAEYGTIDPNFTPRRIYGTCSAANVAAGSGRVFCEGQPVGTVVSDNYLVRTGAFDDAHLTSLNYSGIGSGEKYSFFVSVGANDETGTTADTEAKRRTGRINFRWDATDIVKVDAGFAIGKNDYKLPKGDQDSFGYLIAQGLSNPTTVTRNAAGQLVGGTSQTNDAIRNILNEANSLRVTPSVQVQVNPFRWMTNRITVGADLINTKATTFFPRNNQNWYPTAANGANLGAISSTQDNLAIYTVDYLGNIRTDVGRSGRLVSDLSFGSQYVNTIDNVVTASGLGLITNETNLVGGATTSSVGAQGFGNQKSLGFLMQEQLGFDDKLFVQAAFRVDANSAFGDDAQWFFLPKFGVSYVISEEELWAPLSAAVPTMRLRAAYGTTGRAPSQGAGVRTYSRAPFVNAAGVVAAGVAPGNPGNPDLRAERGKEFEVGLDASFLDDRADVELTYFDKRTTDLLLQQPIAPSLGFPSPPFVNIGKVKNNGFEFMLHGIPVDLPNFSLDATVSGSTLHNEVVTLGGLSPLINSSRIVTAGRSLGAWYAYEVRSVNAVAGTATVSDTAVYLGEQLPTFQGNLSTTVTLFERLRLYLLFDRKSGHKIYNFTQQLADRSVGNSAERNLPADQGGYTAEERLIYFGNTIGGVYNLESGGTIPVNSVVGQYVEDASFTRFREVSATIDLPAMLTRNMRVSGASLTIAGRNLGLWTKFRGDPEVLGTGVGSPGTQFTQFFNAELFTLPPTRQWSARVNLTF